MMIHSGSLVGTRYAFGNGWDHRRDKKQPQISIGCE